MKVRRFLLAAFCLGLIFAISGCKSKLQYTLTVTVSPADSGAVTPQSGAKFEKDTRITLNPIPAAGWVFDHWAGADAGDIVQTEGQWRLMMDADKTVEAVFVPEAGTLSITLTADKSSGTSPLTVAFTGTASGPDGETLTIDWDFGDGNTVTDGGSGQTHTYQSAGDFTARVTVRMDSGETASDEMLISVSVPQNAAPGAVDDSSTVNEDETVLINVLANDSDSNGDALTIFSFTQGGHGTVTSESGKLRYAPAANYHGSDTFTYEASDGKGGTDSGTVTVTVQPVNDNPEAVNDTASVDEDGTLLINVLSNDSDVDGDALSLHSFTQGAHGTVASEENSLRYTPAANYSGADSFTYTVSDGHGGTATGAVTITVSECNEAPVAQSDAASVNEDGTVLISVLTNDSDSDGGTPAINAFTQPAHGLVVQEGNEFRYAPASNYNGTDSFEYTISDGQGGTSTAAVSITIEPVNDGPVAVNDSGSPNEDQTELIDVIANDSDVDGDTITITEFTQGAHGTVVKVGNSLRYTPAMNYSGPDSFTYGISDGHGATSTATVTLTITSVNDAPAAVNDFASVREDETTLVYVLNNDSDVEADTLTITSYTQAAHGMVSAEGNQIRYTPDAGYFGTDSFTYQISDGKGGVSTATVTMTVIRDVLLSLDIDEEDGQFTRTPFTVAQAGNYSIQTSFYLGDCDTVIYIFDSEGNMIAVNDDYTDLYSCIIMWLEPGTYYVAVEELCIQHLYCHLEVKLIF